MTTQDQPAPDRSSRKAAEWLWPLAPIGVSVFCLSALLYYNAHYGIEPRTALQIMIAGIYSAIGLAPSVLFFLLVLTWSSIWFATGKLDRPLVRLGRLLAMAVMLGVFLNLGDGSVPVAPHKGVLGAWLAERLVSAFGYVPSMIVVWAVTFASLLLATDFFFSDSFERLRRRAPAPETGVETAVTDYLRGLESLTPATAGGPAIGNMPQGTARAVWLPEPRLATAPAVVQESATAERSESPAGSPTDELPTHETPGPESPADMVPWAELRRRRRHSDRHHDEELPVEAAPAAAAEPMAGESPSESQPIGQAAAAAEELSIDAEDVVAEVADAEGTGILRAAFEDTSAPEGTAASEGAAASEDTAAAEVTANLDDDADIDDEIASTQPAAGVSDATDLLAIGDATAPADAATTPADVIPTPTAEAAAEEAAEEVPEEAVEELVDEANDEGIDEEGDEVPAADRETVVPIPRPEPAPVTAALAETAAKADEAHAGKQQRLFGGVDETLVEEAVELLHGARRVTAGLLQRRLKIDYPQAMEVMAQLGARGVVQLDADQSQGRVVV